MYWTDCQSSLLPRHVAISRKAKGGCIVQNSKACGINGRVCSEIVQGGAGKRACFCGDKVGGLIKFVPFHQAAPERMAGPRAASLVR